LHEALEKFAVQDPVKAKLVELRFFAGLTLQQAADCLDISLSTADRAWRYARAWLYSAITGDNSEKKWRLADAFCAPASHKGAVKATTYPVVRVAGRAVDALGNGSFPVAIVSDFNCVRLLDAAYFWRNDPTISTANLGGLIMLEIRFFVMDDGTGDRYGWFVDDHSRNTMAAQGQHLFQTKAEVLEYVKTLKTDFFHATITDEKSPVRFSAPPPPSGPSRLERRWWRNQPHRS
jgi:hypothetical protein